VRWAATGIETPMYPSAEARTAVLEEARTKGADELLSWLTGSAAALTDEFELRTDEQWATEVTTFQGRHLPATEIPWLRAREVCVHAVDLDGGVTFADLPNDFLGALVIDICTKRGLDTATLPVGPLPGVTAWLADRPHSIDGLQTWGADSELGTLTWPTVHQHGRWASNPRPRDHEMSPSCSATSMITRGTPSEPDFTVAGDDWRWLERPSRGHRVATSRAPPSARTGVCGNPLEP
jgi:hypothetical protein